MTTVEVLCGGCGTLFVRSAAEVRRQRKRKPDREFFCSLRCYAVHRGRSNLGPHLARGNVSVLRADNRQDEFSPFRYFMRKARCRSRGVNLDLPYLKRLWADQEGRCKVSGLPLVLPRNSLEWERRTHDPWKPSLDRIDPTRGYLKGNVRFVSVMANLARQRFTDAEVLVFCRAVVAKEQGEVVPLMVRDRWTGLPQAFAYTTQRTCFL